MPFLSIIIPTFNSSSTLSKTVDSILLQDFNDYEIWIIDGCSSDNTIEIINNYQAQDKRIHFISEPDKGIYDAMNKGIDLASGKWLYFLGSDDWLYGNDVLKTIFTAAESDKYDVLYGNVYSTKFNGPYDGEFTAEKLYDKNICHQAIFMRKEIFKMTGYFDVHYRTHADWDHNIKWFLHPGITKKYINTVVANYAEGGFSSIHADHEFETNKSKAFFAYKGKGINKKFKSVLFEFRAADMKNKNKFLGWLRFKALSYISRYA